MKDKLLEQAVDYIENVPDDRDSVGHIDRHALVAALKERLAQSEQEPVAWEQFYDPKRVQDMLQDVSTMGSAWSRGGERIDPMSVYKGFEPEAMPENNGGKPTAWYDPSNGVVSTDRDSPLFTPLGQVWALYLSTDKERILQLIKELRPAIKPMDGLGKGKTTHEWFDILVKDIEEKI